MKVNLFSTETEKDIIGQLLLDPDAYGRLEQLSPNHFYSGNLATVYRTIQRINADGKQADLLTVLDHLKRTGELQNIGGTVFLVDLQGTVFSSALIQQSESRIIEYYRKRTLNNSLQTLTAKIESLESDEIASEIMAALQKIETGNDTGFRAAEDVCHEFLAGLDAGNKNVIPTAFYDLDRLLNGGLRPSDYHVIAAITSMGKTALALNIADNIVRTGIPVGFVSLEMTGAQLIERLAYSSARLEKKSDPSPIDIQKIVQTTARIATFPLFIEDSGISDFGRLLSRICLLIRRHKIRVLFVDYLQLLHYKGETRNLEIQAISGALKQLAIRERIVVVALSQLNRAVNGFPVLSNLRDSGAIEQDADQVLFIHRPEQLGQNTFNGEDADGMAFCGLAKHRNGPTGQFRLSFKNANFENFSNKRAF